MKYKALFLLVLVLSVSPRLLGQSYYYHPREVSKVYQKILDTIFNNYKDQFDVRLKSFIIYPQQFNINLKNYDFDQSNPDPFENLQKNELYENDDWKQFLLSIDTGRVDTPRKIDIRRLKGERSYKITLQRKGVPSDYYNKHIAFSSVIFTNDFTRAVCVANYSESAVMYFFEKRKKCWQIVYRKVLFLT